MSTDTTEPVFARVRDAAVMVGQIAAQVDLTDIDAALEEADRAQSFGPIFDPTAFMRGTDSLDDQIRYLRAFRTFRAAIEGFRP